MAGESFYRSSATLDAMADLERIAGGCDDCDAHQTVDQAEPGVYVLTVHHDGTCPNYRQIVAQRSGAL